MQVTCPGHRSTCRPGAKTTCQVPGALRALRVALSTQQLSLKHKLSPVCCMQVDTYMPPWLQDYMSGTSQELYKLPAFPACLVGCSVREAAGFMFDAFHAVLLAVEGAGVPHGHRLSVGDLDQVGSYHVV
jgi:hypothetical protein